MAHHGNDHRDEWKQRLQAVGRAQARYLYVLLVAGVFYWALHVQVTSSPSVVRAERHLPVIGVEVNQVVVWATGPTILGLIILATLGTLHALHHPAENLGASAQDDDTFERLDIVPTAIDFIVYAKSPWLSRLGRLSYPGFLSLVYLEAWWVWYAVGRVSTALPGQTLFLLSGAGVLLICIPRLAALWVSKGARLFKR